MPEGKGRKRTFVSISSSSEEDDEQSTDESESESEDNDEEYDDDAGQSSDLISLDDGDDSASDWSNDKGDESDDQETDEYSDSQDDESLCNIVTSFLQERTDLQELNINDCKAYLRQHGIRVTGTKAECIQRIKEHWRIKDGNGVALYPRSSFIIDCTGDVCKGDVVLFTQKVYEKFNKVTKRGSLLGKRTVAGRVVKESYGAARQQHTFSVEVLWSKGIKKLPPLFPLLVKGRNLYRLKTFRQRWKNEAERGKVLTEKHKRGAAARHKRAMNKAKKSLPANANGGVKRQKHFNPSKTSGLAWGTEPQKGKRIDECRKASKGHVKSDNHRRKVSELGKVNSKHSSKLQRVKPSRRHQNLTHANINIDSGFQSHTYSSQSFHQSHLEFTHHNAPFHLPINGIGSTSSTIRFPHLRPDLGSSFMPETHLPCFNNPTFPHHTHLHNNFEFEPRNLHRFPERMNIHRPFYPGPFGKGRHGRGN